VVRTDVGERQQVDGVLGFSGALSITSQSSGTLTWIAPPGVTVRAGGELAEVDGVPTYLMVGARPAWRAFAPGMSDGPDVRQLEAQLRAAGDDPAHVMTIDEHFSAATAAAVRRWQHAHGQPQIGTLALGAIAFLPSPVRVGSDTVAVGTLVAPGQPLLTGTTTAHDVTVELPTAQQTLVHVGDRVVVTLPDGTTTTPGHVTFVSKVASPATTTGSPQGQPAGPATVTVTVALTNQKAAGALDQAPVQVAITDQLHRGVLAVPVTALLATPGGGYAVTLTSTHAAVPVTVGLFDDLTQLVEVSGARLNAGDAVEVPTP
jgi:peptidoglycan hydrolase-like protein with peptidoglycan-binding domain